jgi:hypothetical protein
VNFLKGKKMVKLLFKELHMKKNRLYIFLAAPSLEATTGMSPWVGTA